MQKARIRTGWKNRQKQISVADFANALSAILWRLSLNAAKNLHQQGFEYRSDDQRLGVIAEYLFFLMHCSDRLMVKQFESEDRIIFVHALAADCQRHYLQNRLEISATQSTPEVFINGYNSRSSSYSLTDFPNNQPGYEMYRAFGASVQQIMGNDQTNKWVTDQVMEIDGPEVFEIFKKSLLKLKRGAGVATERRPRSG